MSGALSTLATRRRLYDPPVGTATRPGLCFLLVTCHFLFCCFHSLGCPPLVSSQVPNSACHHLGLCLPSVLVFLSSSLLPIPGGTGGRSGGWSQGASEVPSQCSFDLFHSLSFCERCCLTKKSTAKRKSLQSFCINAAAVMTGSYDWPVEMKGLSGEPGPVALSCWALPIQ